MPENRQYFCPVDQSYGKPIKMLTLKSLLRPEVLDQLDTAVNYKFCGSPDCQVAYFCVTGQTFAIEDVKVPIFCKDNGEEVPVCYCFGWSRKRILDEIAFSGMSTAISSIKLHIQAGDCRCDVNNPKGSCCFGDVQHVVQQV